MVTAVGFQPPAGSIEFTQGGAISTWLSVQPGGQEELGRVGPRVEVRRAGEHPARLGRRERA